MSKMEQGTSGLATTDGANGWAAWMKAGAGKSRRQSGDDALGSDVTVAKSGAAATDVDV